MSFTRALVYPEIEIPNEVWLKNALLFWDELNTIVPYGLDNYCISNTNKYLYDIGVIKPIFVDSNSIAVTHASQEFLTRYDGLNFDINFRYKGKCKKTIHSNKMSGSLRKFLTRVYNENEKWVEVEPTYHEHYMQLLAKEVSKEYGISVLTSNPCDAQYISPRDYNNSTKQSKYGVLMNIIFKTIRIDENTSIEQILSFKEDNKRNLIRFRKAVELILEPVDDNLPLEAHRQKIEDIYKNQFEAALSDLKEALTEHKIKWFLDNIMSIFGLSAAASSLPVLLGMSVPTALFVSGVLSVVCIETQAYRNKKELLAQNYTTYVLTAEKEFGKNIT